MALANAIMAPEMLSGSIGPGFSRLLMRAMKSSSSFWLFMPTVSMLRANSWVSSDSGRKPDSDGGGALEGLLPELWALLEGIA